MRTILFHISPAAEVAAKHVVTGLKLRWTSADYKFDYEFNSKTGDFVVYADTNHVIPKAFLKRLQHEA